MTWPGTLNLLKCLNFLHFIRFVDFKVKRKATTATQVTNKTNKEAKTLLSDATEVLSHASKQAKKSTHETDTEEQGKAETGYSFRAHSSHPVLEVSEKEKPVKVEKAKKPRVCN